MVPIHSRDVQTLLHAVQGKGQLHGRECILYTYMPNSGSKDMPSHVTVTSSPPFEISRASTPLSELYYGRMDRAKQWEEDT